MAEKEANELLEEIRDLMYRPKEGKRITQWNDISRVYLIKPIFGDLSEAVASIEKRRAGTALFYWRTLSEIMTAIGLAFGTIEETDLDFKDIDEEEFYYKNQNEWSLELSKVISEHLKKKEKWFREVVEGH